MAMMILVVGVTATTLLITENQVRASYERHFRETFKFQTQTFLEQRETRLAPIQEGVAEAGAARPRLIAAMENAGQPGAEQKDVDDLYQNGLDQLLEFVGVNRNEKTVPPGGFFFFLNTKGEVLYPSSKVRLPFVFPGLGALSRQIEAVGLAVGRDGLRQVGYLAPRVGEEAGRLCEMVFTPVVDQVSRQKLGVLAVGFPLPSTGPAAQESKSTLLSGIWLDGQLYSASIPDSASRQLAQAIGGGPANGNQAPEEFRAPVFGVPHQVYCQTLNTGKAFPVARQVCLYSLADAEAEMRRFRQKILISGSIALLAAFGLSFLISRGMTVPLQELVNGSTQIEHGNYAVKVPVRRNDEIGHLAQSFNDMAQRIQASYVAQEQRLEERTRELAERKRTEAALRVSETSLREAQRIARLGNWRWNIKTDELLYSDEVCSIFGLSRERFGATYSALLDRVHPEDRETVVQGIRQTLEAKGPFALEHRVLRGDGELRIVHERAELICDETGKAIQLVGTIQDITEQKRIEAEALRAQRMDSIGALAGGMAHDLNNALSPILMGIQLIRRQAKDPETRQMLSVMEANTNRGADMVRQVLTFARGRENERELLDVGRLLREMENIVRQTLPKSITVAAMAPRDLWPVLGNATQLHQVLLNLCINARDAMPDGGELTLAADNVELKAEDAKEIADAVSGSYVMLLVSDTGTGIPPEVLPRLFEPFFTTKGVGKGTGLGLSTIARIVRNHGGFISVKSAPGEGACFEIYVPRAEAASEPSRPPSTALAGTVSGNGELILFVDDDRSVREMVGPPLLENGYRLLTAANGAEALVLLSQSGADVRLVLTDVAMPVMDGREFLAALRTRRPDLPVIFMSGSLEISKGPLPAGVGALLNKPFRLEELLAVIGQALKR
ncbi:MAG: hypothetical protein C5B50_25645 [Verrucomicrobia bacterium]|nr:MAG: hypothetical protein C5B50_25645 [Verrucomicrobiota bacterium]